METIQETAADKYADHEDQNLNPNQKGLNAEIDGGKAPKAIRAGAAITKMQEIAKSIYE